MRQQYTDSNRLLRTSRSSLYCYWGLALLMAALYALLSFFTPYYLDDWTFMGNWRDDAANQGFSWAGWWRYYTYIRGYDNGRIANALSPISTMISPWKDIFPWVTGLSVALTAVMLQRLATGSRSVLYLSICWILMIAGLPWNDTIFVRDYSLNYIWASAITLALLGLMRMACLSEKNGRVFLLLAILTAVPAGGWHEGFAVCTICGLGFLAISRKFRLPGRFYIILAVYLASTLLFMLSPGIMGRAANALAENHSYILKRPLLIVGFDCVIFLLLLVKRTHRKNEVSTGSILIKTLNSPLAIVSIGILVSGFILGFCSTNTPRSFFWPDMGAIALGLYLIRQIIGDTRPGSSEKKISSRSIFINTSTAVLVLLCTAQTVAVLVWQIRYERETKKIMALLDRSESGTVFYDITLPTKAPAYTLGIPVANMWSSKFHYAALWSYYLTPVIGVVPEELRNATRHQMESDTLRLRIPDYIDGEMVYPFVSECGDTLVYRAPL